MKKNWFLRIGLIALVLTVATTCLVGGTFAKYTTTVSGADTIEVARFGFTATDATDALATPAATLNLFDNAATGATGTVAANNIAPGVGGTFYIVLDATTTDVDLNFVGSTLASAITGDAQEALTTATAFISFKAGWGVGATVAAATTAADGQLNDLDYYEVGGDSRLTLANMDAQLTAKLAGFIVQKNTALVIKVAYAWVEDSLNDADDTAIGQGIAANTAISSTVTVIASQIVATNESAPTYSAEGNLGIVLEP